MRKLKTVKQQTIPFDQFEPYTHMQNQDSTGKTQTKLPLSVHIMAGWPMLLMLIGGAIGGALGVVAYLINLKVYQSDLSKMNKILANLMCGMFAIIIWWSIASWVQTSL